MKIVAIVAAVAVCSGNPQKPAFDPSEFKEKTVDEMREFWDALGYEEGLCAYQEDAAKGRIRWRRCLVDKRDNRKSPE